MKTENRKVNDPSDEDEKIDIEAIVGDVLFSMKYGTKDCEYDRVFDLFNYVDYINSFLTNTKNTLKERPGNQFPISIQLQDKYFSKRTNSKTVS